MLKAFIVCSTHSLVAHPQQLLVRVKGHRGHSKVASIDQHLAPFHELWLSIGAYVKVRGEGTVVGRRTAFVH